MQIFKESLTENLTSFGQLKIGDLIQSVIYPESFFVFLGYRDELYSSLEVKLYNVSLERIEGYYASYYFKFKIP